MRIKTLLLTAALSVATIATAKADVFSVNVVGYVNQTIPLGFSIINNPLVNSNNTVATLFPNPPLFSTIFKFTGGSFSAANTFGFGGWGDPNQVLAPGEGFFFNAPSAFTNTYVGEVLIGAQTNVLIAGYNLVGSKVPQAGALQATLGLTPALFDTVYQFASGAYLPANTFGFGGWANGDPSISVGEGFFYFNGQASPNNWSRTFDPNTP